MLSFFPRDVLDEILNLIGSVSEGFHSYSWSSVPQVNGFKNLTFLPFSIVVFGFRSVGDFAILEKSFTNRL